MQQLSNSDFDRIDLKLIELLQSNARASVVDLAKKVNLSPTPCTLRIRRLEKLGAITGYHARVSPLAVNQRLMVFVTVKLKATDEKTLEKFNGAVKPVKQILECHMVGGGFDYLLKIRVSDMNEYRAILGGVLGNLPMVEATHSYFVMEEVKESPVLPIGRGQA